MDGTRVLLAAHRGDQKNCPENTMPAFEAAIRAGVDMIETDVHMTRDGELVLIHDANTLRTTGIDGIVTEMTLAELRALDAGRMKDESFTGVRIPTVREFLERIRRERILVNWELKDYPDVVGEARAQLCVDKLVALIREAGMEKRSMMNSFSSRLLEYIHRRWGREFPIHGQGIHNCRHSRDLPETAEKNFFDWCCLYPDEPGKSPVDFRENFDYCIENGILPCVCIPDSVESYEAALRLGCKMFTSNDIHAAHDILRRLGVRK